MMGYKLYVRDQYFNRIAEIEDYQNCDMIIRFNSPGTWVLDIPTNCDAAQEFIKSKSGIVIVKDGKTLLSGPVTGRKRKWDKDGDRLTVNGFDDLIWLQRNLAYPVPLGPPYTAADYDVRTGKAESVMKAYLDSNIGVNARPERKMNITSAVDQGLGSTVTGRARFHTLLELFTSLALAGGDLGFRVVQVNNALQFQVYQPSDKTKSAVFSPLLGNLLGFEYSSEDPETNYTIVGGQGEGATRTLLEKGDSSSISNYGRIENFIDRRDTADSAVLIQAMDEELAQKAEKMSLSISPVDTELLIFGKDYNLGDKVSVILSQSDTSNLVKISDVVREIKITLNNNVETIIPSVGTPDSVNSNVLGIFDKMKKINKRLSNLERR